MPAFERTLEQLLVSYRIVSYMYLSRCVRWRGSARLVERRTSDREVQISILGRGAAAQ